MHAERLVVLTVHGWGVRCSGCMSVLHQMRSNGAPSVRRLPAVEAVPSGPVQALHEIRVRSRAFRSPARGPKTTRAFVMNVLHEVRIGGDETRLARWHRLVCCAPSMTSGFERLSRAAVALRTGAPGPVLALSHGALAVALFIADGHLNGFALVFTLGAIAGLALALRELARGRDPDVESAVPVAWLIQMLFAAFAFGRPPGVYIQVGLAPYDAIAALIFGLLATYGRDVLGDSAWPSGFVALRRVLLFVAGGAVGAWLLRASPNPEIDLFPLHQQAAEVLLAGKSIYARDSLHVIESFRHTGTIDQYTYLPLGACLATLAYAATHDHRWAYFLAQLVGVVLLWRVARKSSLHSPRGAAWSDLLAALLLFHPRGPFVLEQAWTEPIALPFLGGVVLAIASGRPILASVLLGLLCATKQHLALYVLFLAFVPGIGLRGVVLAGLTALGTILPFVLRDPRDFYWAVLGRHSAGWFREDSLSVPAVLYHLGIKIPAWVGFLAAMAPVPMIGRYPRNVTSLLLASCVAFGLFYLFGRQAFCNYYYLLDATVLFVAATLPFGQCGAAGPPAKREA
jgi:hypothetical protein